jgi:NAD(P)-dependent dehydrogenase (short-subunit alcohol dehydrogenase family)
MALRFDGKVAVVTGGAMGIGAATAKLLCELGASVAIFDRDARATEKTVDLLLGAGHTASSHMCNVEAECEIEDSVNEVVKRYGHLDILVSNAGTQTYGTVVSTTCAAWDEAVDTHVKGCFYATKYAIPRMLASGGGSIVVVASVQSFAAVSNSASYVTAKHALLGITRSIALDFARENIRANCVCPGSIGTPLLYRSVGPGTSPENVAAVLGPSHALGRIGRPDEVARAIAFLASDWSSFITGTSLVVDGGLLLAAGGIGFQDSSVEAQA